MTISWSGKLEMPSIQHVTLHSLELVVLQSQTYTNHSCTEKSIATTYTKCTIEQACHYKV